MARKMIGRDHIVDEKHTLVDTDTFVPIFCSVEVPNMSLITVHIRGEFLIGAHSQWVSEAMPLSFVTQESK